jgi:phosphate transport system protein
MTEHTVKSCEHELRNLAQRVVEMGALVERQIREAVEGLIKREEALAQGVVAADAAVDAIGHEIEATAILLLAKRQPVVSDLREIVGALRISIDLERVGDFAKNIGKRLGAIKNDSYPTHLVKRIEHMADLAVGQLKDVLDSYTQHDTAKTIDVWRRDEEIDAIYISLFRELLTYMMEFPRSITFSTHLLFCAKNVERIGDHTTNIAETVHYMLEGVPLKEDRPKSHTTASGLYASFA